MARSRRWFAVGALGGGRGRAARHHRRRHRQEPRLLLGADRAARGRRQGHRRHHPPRRPGEEGHAGAAAGRLDPRVRRHRPPRRLRARGDAQRAAADVPRGHRRGGGGHDDPRRPLREPPAHGVAQQRVPRARTTRHGRRQGPDAHDRGPEGRRGRRSDARPSAARSSSSRCSRRARGRWWPSPPAAGSPSTARGGRAGSPTRFAIAIGARQRCSWCTRSSPTTSPSATSRRWDRWPRRPGSRWSASGRRSKARSCSGG